MNITPCLGKNTHGYPKIKIEAPLKRNGGACCRDRLTEASRTRRIKMSKSKSTIMNPNARDAMDRFKMQAAGDVGVNLKQGYNGDITSKQAGSIGGQMVKDVCPARLLKNVQFMRKNRVVNGRKTVVKYIVGVTV